jgi:outer membrane protein assembly factor BamB
MNTRAIFGRLSLVSLMSLLILSAGVDAASESTSQKRAQIDLPGGLCLHIGLGSGSRTIKLCRDGKFLVHGLDASTTVVTKVQKMIAARGAYGLIQVEHFAGAELPYYDHTITKVVLEKQGTKKIAIKEIYRVLRPGGQLIAGRTQATQAALTAAGFKDVKQTGGEWVGIKPWPTQMDDWTHFRHGPGRNPVSKDTLVGVSNSVRWIMGRTGQGSMMLSSNGINLYVSRSRVYARDSFTGLPLWDGTRIDGKLKPVATDTHLYAAQGDKLVAIDLSTGKVAQTFKSAGAAPRDLVIIDQKAIVSDESKTVWAVDLKTGNILWKYDCASPHNMVAGDGHVYFIQGNVRRASDVALVSLALADGKVIWAKSGAGYSFASKSKQSAYANGMIAYEISTYSDTGKGNSVHVVNAKNGQLVKERNFTPGMTHKKQANAFIVGNEVRVQQGRSFQTIVSKGKTSRAVSVGTGHCFTGVATPRFFIHGEMNFTDLRTGKYYANRITKGACGGGTGTPGYVPANGLLYSFPKHCVCFPMLEGYAAFASIGKRKPSRENRLTKGTAKAPAKAELELDIWPMYRRDATRSSGTAMKISDKPLQLWQANVIYGKLYNYRNPPKSASKPKPLPGPIATEWSRNPYSGGVISAPVIANGIVAIAIPDRHRIDALNAHSGKKQWSFTANGRIDSAPTIHKGVCMFGTRSGYIYGLNAKDGKLLWKLRATPFDRRIVAYGQLESSWPVAGSILIHNDLAYATAGRHPLADGGVQVIAFKPSNGYIKWRGAATDTGITRGYNRQGLDFDYFDHLVLDGSTIAMSRWQFHPTTGQTKLNRTSGFFKAGSTAVQAPRGFWKYGYPNNRRRTEGELLAYHGDSIFGIHKGKLFRRDFNYQKPIADKWFSEYEEGKSKHAFDRLAAGSKWSVAAPGQVQAMLVAGDRLLLVSKDKLKIYDTQNGKQVGEQAAAQPIPDGLAAAYNNLYLSTRDGRVICYQGGGSKR